MVSQACVTVVDTHIVAVSLQRSALLPPSSLLSKLVQPLL